MELTKQQEMVGIFRNWYEGRNAQQGQGSSLKTKIEENRRRYRMILPDAAKRIDLGLSALPSTKSCSIVDNAVVDAIQEYYQTDAITFTAQDSGDVNKDHLAAWLTELFKLRAKKNGFWVWHLQSLKAGFVDGLEAALVRWRKEDYEYTEKHYFFNGQEIPEEEYKAAKAGEWPIVEEGQFNPATGKPDTIKIAFDDLYRMEKVKKRRVVADTWECVQLKPGENLLWDFKNPLLDLNRGQWCMVVLQWTADEILAASKAGLFKKITAEELKPHLTTQSANRGNYNDTTALSTDPDTVDAGDYNTAEVWLAFERKNFQWEVSFSIAGELELMGPTSVNEIFFGGRPFDRLPVVLGASDIELWEALGRGIPKLIAPIEDELTDHRNNLNDIGKQAVTGKYRVNEDYDGDLNALLNDRVFFAKPGDVEKLDFSGEMMAALKAADLTGGDIASLAPVSMADPNMIGKGNAKGTLGAVQLAAGNNNAKLSARLLVRNITFMEPLLAIVAEMHMAFETDETLARVAGKRGKVDVGKLETVIDGKPAIDFSLLDFDVEVQINAGLGNTPKQLKAQKLLVYYEWAKANGVPIDVQEVDKQIKVLNGFNEDQFILPEDKQKPSAPPVEYKATVNIDLTTLLQLHPAAGQFLAEKLMGGGMNVTAAVSDKTPSYLKDDAMGSPSHPSVQGQMEQPQGEMEMM